MILMIAPRAQVSAGRINEVLDTRSSVVPARERRDHGHPARRTGLRPGQLRLPRRRDPGAQRGELRRPARPHHRHHRLDRRRQDHPGQPDPPVVRRDRGAGSWWTGWTSANSIPTCCGSRIGLVPQKPYLFQRDGRQQPAAWEPRRDRRRALAGAGDRPGAQVRRAGCRRGWTPRSPRAAPTSPGASASGSRSPAPWCGVRRSMSSTTRSRRSTSPTDAAAAGGPGPRDRGSRGDRGRPAGLHDPLRGSDHRAGGRPDRGPGHP